MISYLENDSISKYVCVLNLVQTKKWKSNIQI